MGSDGKRRGREVFFLLIPCFFFLFVFSGPASGGIRDRNVKIALSVGEGILKGTVSFSIVNDGFEPLGEIPFLLYPNHFTRKFLLEMYGEEVEGDHERPGAMSLRVVEPSHGAKMSGEGVLRRLILDDPIEVGEKRKFSLAFETRVPNHYACFSAVRDSLYLQGGMFPMPYFEEASTPALNEEGTLDLEVTVDATADRKRLFVFPAGEYSASGGELVYRVEGNFRDVGIFVADYDVEWIGVGDFSIPLYSERLSSRQKEQVRKTLDEVSDFLRARAPKILPFLRNLRLIEAPLRKRVAFFTSYGVVISDRIFDSIFLFQGQHREVLAESILGFLAASMLRNRSSQAITMAEFVGGLLNLEYRVFASLRLRDLRKTVKPFTFIPTFDRIYYERDLPFSRSYMRTIYKFGIPGEDFPSRKIRRITGDSILRLFAERFPGLPWGEMVDEYFSGKSLEESLKKRGLFEYFTAIENGNPYSDYAVSDVVVEDGIVSITVENRRPITHPEVVDVLISFSSGREVRKRWDTSRKKWTFVVKLEDGEELENVVVDPRVRYDDVDRSNNFYKRPIRILLQSTRFNYEFNTGSIVASALVSVRRAYDRKRAVQFFAYKTEDSSALEVSYAHAIRIKEEGGDYLREGVRITHDSSVISSESTIMEFKVGLERSAFELEFLPAGNFGGNVSGSMGFYGKGGRKSFYSIEGRLVRYFPVTLRTTIAAKLDGGAVTGDVPSSRALDLGGRDHVRGLKPGDVLMKSYLVGTFEFREFLSKDLDLDMPWGILSLDGFAVHVFVDAGLGKYSRYYEGFRRGARASAGVGLFWTGNFLGIAPVKMNFQFARELDRFNDNTTYFYFRMNQSF